MENSLILLGFFNGTAKQLSRLCGQALFNSIAMYI